MLPFSRDARRMVRAGGGWLRRLCEHSREEEDIHIHYTMPPSTTYQLHCILDVCKVLQIEEPLAMCSAYSAVDIGVEVPQLRLQCIAI